MTPASEAVKFRWILAAVSMALFCVQIDYFAVNLALPADGFRIEQHSLRPSVGDQHLHARPRRFHGACGPDRRHVRAPRVLLAGVALFGLASALCALAPSATLLIAFRALQGLGAALIFPVSVSVLTNAFPAARAGHAIGLAYGIAGLGNAAGPLIGGLLTQTVGWRWIFRLNVPLTLVSLAIGARSITESSDDTAPRRIDIAGLALVTVGIGLFTLAFDRASSWGWLSASTAIAFAGALAALAVFVTVENRVRVPLVDLSLFVNRRFTILVVAGTVANVAYAVTIFISTMYLQQVRGLDPLTAGLVFLGPSVGAALGGVLAGRLAASRPPVLVMGLTSVVAALSLAALAASRSWAVYLPALTACGLTLGLVYAFTTVATQAVVRTERAGEAAGVTLTALVTLAGVGVAVSGTVLEILQRAGMTAAGAVDAIVAVLAALVLPVGAVVLSIARASEPGT